MHLRQVSIGTIAATAAIARAGLAECYVKLRRTDQADYLRDQVLDSRTFWWSQVSPAWARWRMQQLRVP